MSQHREPDPIDALRASNPVSSDQLSSASLARIRARVHEETMSITASPPAGFARFRRVGAGLAAAAAVALVLVIGGNAGGGLTPGGTSGPGSAACVEQYDLATLARRTFAFDGTVTSITGDRVTFAIGTAFHGVTGTTVTLDANGMTGAAVTSVGGPTLIVGERYLVAGDASFVWACGFTQPYDASVAASWAAALGS